MKLVTIVENILLEGPLDDAVTKYVGDDKVISNELYSKILDASQGKTQYVLWLMMRIMDKSIHPDSLHVYKKHLQTFEKFKNLFSVKDLSQIKTKDDIDRSFTYQAGRIEGMISKNTVSGPNYINDVGVINLRYANIFLLGVTDGYQLFEVSNDCYEEEYDVYKKYFGKCANRDQGEIVSLCTIAEYDSFRKYLDEFSGSKYYVLYNLSDASSPYQFHFESKQFKSKNNRDIDIKSFPETISLILGKNPELEEYLMTPEESRYERYLKDPDFKSKLTSILNFFNRIWRDEIDFDRVTVAMEDSFNEEINYTFGSDYGSRGEDITYRMGIFHQQRNGDEKHLIDTLRELTDDLSNDWTDDNSRYDPRESIDYVLEFINYFEDYEDYE